MTNRVLCFSEVWLLVHHEAGEADTLAPILIQHRIRDHRDLRLVTKEQWMKLMGPAPPRVVIARAKQFDQMKAMLTDPRKCEEVVELMGTLSKAGVVSQPPPPAPTPPSAAEETVNSIDAKVDLLLDQMTALSAAAAASATV